MRPVIFSQTGVGFSDGVRVDYRQPNFKVGVGCVITDAPTYTLEHSFDGVTWFPNSDSALVDATTNQDTNFGYPIDQVRINITAVTGSGTVTVTLLQGS